MATERNTRIYAVTTEGKENVALVEAKTKTAALQHVANRSHKVEIASQSQMFAAAKAGIEIEKAGEEQPLG